MSATQAHAARLQLEGELTIYRAAELKVQLMVALDGAPTLELDLSAVTEIDCTGIQLLMLAKRLAANRQRALRLTRHSPAVIEALMLLDLVPQFGDAIEVPMAHAGL
jgi:anti-sigma B factor antagonist